MKRNRKFRVLIVILLSLLGIAMILAPMGIALARAGGGENYGGGGGGDGGGGGGSSGGGGDGGLFAILFALIFSHLPWPLKLLAIIVIIVFIVRASRKKKATVSGVNPVPQSSSGPANVYTSVSSTTATIDVGAQIEELKARDPNFSKQQFEDLASTAFFKIQDAWSKREMSSAQAFVSPSLLQRFSSQLDGFKREGKINKVDKLAVGSVDIAEIAHDGGNDYITVMIKAAAADYIVNEKTGQILSGSTNVTQFTEFWSFLRSDQVKTPAGTPELISKHCPNCGAPMNVNAIGKCEYCGSELTSGHFSWVLSEITQASVWKPRAVAVRPQNVSPLAAGRYVLGIVQCPQCGANVQDVAGITNEKCWRCGATVETKQ